MTRDVVSNEPFKMQQGSVEEGLLAACKSTDQWLQVCQFDIDDFTVRKDLYIFIGQYLQQYGNLPSASQISTRFTWNPPIGDFAYWLDEMKRYTLARRVLEALMEAREKIADPNAALSGLMGKLSLLRSKDTNHMQAYDAGAMERLELFDNRTERIFKSHEILGIPTGLRVIDDTQEGWMPGNLIGIVARPSVGKTWLLLWFGFQAWLAGSTVLCIASEMPANQLSLRIDLMASDLLGHPMDYRGLRKGDPSVRENYARVMGKLAENQRWWTYDSFNGKAIGLSEVTSLIQLHRPDIVLVDGVSRMRGSRPSEWEKLIENCYGLQSLATINEIPIIINHWPINMMKGRKVSDDKVSGRGDTFVMPSLNDIAYGDSFAQSCSDVIALAPDEVSPNVTWFSIRKHRERGWENPLPSRMGLITDFSHGRIIDLSLLGHNPQLVGEESRRVLNL